MKNIHTATYNGHTFTRTSKTRRYAFCAVAVARTEAYLDMLKSRLENSKKELEHAIANPSVFPCSGQSNVDFYTKAVAGSQADIANFTTEMKPSAETWSTSADQALKNIRSYTRDRFVWVVVPCTVVEK